MLQNTSLKLRDVYIGEQYSVECSGKHSYIDAKFGKYLIWALFSFLNEGTPPVVYKWQHPTQIEIILPEQCVLHKRYKIKRYTKDGVFPDFCRSKLPYD